MDIKAEHELFIENFVECGDVRKAAVDSGYEASYGRTLFRKLRERIQQVLDDELAIRQVKALKTLDDSMGDKAIEAKQDIRLRAAESVLDRAGMSRKQSLEVAGSNLPAIMILPGKDPVPDSAPTK